MKLTNMQKLCLLGTRDRGFVTSNDYPSKTLVNLLGRKLIRVVDRFPSGTVKFVLTKEGIVEACRINRPNL